MPKPFKLTTPEPTLGRRSDGKFVRIQAPLPAQVIAKNSADTGATNNEALRAARVPDREVGDDEVKDVSGPNANAPAPVYPDAIPWPEAGPINDAGKVPFKLTR
jgi:hypothetical protein